MRKGRSKTCSAKAAARPVTATHLAASPAAPHIVFPGVRLPGPSLSVSTAPAARLPPSACLISSRNS
ncbi:hypothetical protein E2C01_067167 [Portunus trituberculatus]|uniref:Uncharacterized protein n=1 Tax=Portunus trituberculatus TaxID=210409 RepID=A0A5B7HRX4_PORTR|nr:hypothetical protein [Portunus trituberculatus]